MYPQHSLAQTLGELAREYHSHSLLLHGLNEQEVARFIELSAGFVPSETVVTAVQRQTEGNPFFVTEVVHLLASADDRSAVTNPQFLLLFPCVRAKQSAVACWRFLRSVATS